MWIYSDDIFLEHDTGEGHPERPERLRRIVQHLRVKPYWQRCRQPPIAPVTRQRLERVHTEAYLERVRALAEGGGGRLDADTIVSSRSYDVALRATGAACDAVDRVLGGGPSPPSGEHLSDSRALCLVRPPGHHASPGRGMGFCLFNSVAVAAEAALQDHQVDRVLIVDWDVHHGNGTQDTFWESDRVGFLSIHRYPFYPGTGAAEETGHGPGLGMTRNLPMTFGVSRSDYHARFEQELLDFAGRVRPDLVLISAGFDSHRLDPIGSLGLEEEDFSRLTDAVLQVADQYAAGRVISLLEGGYNVDVLGSSVACHLERLLREA